MEETVKGTRSTAGDSPVDVGGRAGSGTAFRLAGRQSPVDPSMAHAQRGDLIVLVGTTTRVLDDCRIQNGALVVAPSQLPSYPVAAPDGMTCRPGETLPLAIAASDGLGRNERQAVLDWLTRRAGGFNDEGYLRRAYALHGRVTDRRPDRLGTALLLWSVCAHPDRATAEPVRAIVRQLAAGLALGRDRRQASPSATVDLAESAASAMALRGVSAILPADEWGRAAAREEERRDGLHAAVLAALQASREGPVLESDRPSGPADAIDAGPRRLFPDDGSERAALLALGWLPGIQSTLRDGAIERLVGTLLAEDPAPDARVPVADLFWLTIALEQAGRSDRAGELFAATVDLADSDGHFPEWVENAGGVERAATPYLPAHLAFLLAAGVLGRLADLPRSGYTSAKRRTSG